MAVAVAGAGLEAGELNGRAQTVKLSSVTDRKFEWSQT